MSFNESDTVWPQLLNVAGDASKTLKEGELAYGVVDLDGVLCSKCNLPDRQSDDILLCDRVNCCRAYHQNCEDPPVRHVCVDDSPWFCGECKAVDPCLLAINELYSSNFQHAREVKFDDSSVSRILANVSATVFLGKKVSRDFTHRLIGYSLNKACLAGASLSCHDLSRQRTATG